MYKLNIASPTQGKEVKKVPADHMWDPSAEVLLGHRKLLHVTNFVLYKKGTVLWFNPECTVLGLLCWCLLRQMTASSNGVSGVLVLLRQVTGTIHYLMAGT